MHQPQKENVCEPHLRNREHTNTPALGQDFIGQVNVGRVADSDIFTSAASRSMLSDGSPVMIDALASGRQSGIVWPGVTGLQAGPGFPRLIRGFCWLRLYMAAAARTGEGRVQAAMTFLIEKKETLFAAA